MEIVRFKNGKYGIRKRNLFYKLFQKEGLFRDFKGFSIKWRESDDKYFADCQLDSLDEVVNHFNNIAFCVIEKVLYSND